MSTKGEEYISFTQLSDDCLLQIFKYLTLRERIALERTCREWTPLLTSLWMQQRVLSIGPRFDWDAITLPYCLLKEHHLRDTDHFDDPQDYDKYCKQLLKHCSNLRALYLSSSEVDDQLKECLFKLCPDLEHFYVVNESSLEKIIIPFLEKERNAENEEQVGAKLTCLWVRELELQGFSASFQKLIEQKCPNLIEMVVMKETDLSFFPLLSDISVGLEGNINKLFDYEFKSKVQNIFLNQSLEEIITTFGENRLDFTCFSNLKSVAFRGQLMTLSQVKLPRSLEEISISSETVSPVNDDCISFVAFLETLGSRLKSFDFRGYTCDGYLLRDLSTICPNIEMVSIGRREDDHSQGVDDIDCTSLARLSKLRDFILCEVRVNNREIRKLLNICPKLRKIDLMGCQSFTSEIFLDMVSYSALHVKRVVKVIVDRYLVNELEDEYSGVTIKGNLRIYYKTYSEEEYV